MNTIETTETFDAWLAALHDQNAVSRINARIFRAEMGGFGDCKTISEGVSEMRIHYGLGYRLYFKQTGRTIYLLLAGGDKSTQDRDVRVVLELARQLKDEQE